MPASPNHIKLDGKRVSIGMFADVDDSLWRTIFFTHWSMNYPGAREEGIRSNVELRANLVRNLVEEGVTAMEDWIDAQLAKGCTKAEIFEMAQHGFRLDATPCDDGRVVNGVRGRRWSRATRRYKDRLAVRQLLSDAREEFEKGP